MKRICAIISGGDESCFTKIEDVDYIIACDKGYLYALNNDIKVDLVIGDFDSYTGDINEAVNVLRLPIEKDDTDMMTSIRYAVDNKYTDIYVYCALGGRLDHMLGNIQAIMYAASNGIRVHVFDFDNDIYVFSDSCIKLGEARNYSLSVLSLSDKCIGVDIEGAKYQLHNATLTNKFPIGISNVWDGDVTISVKSGIMMVILSKINNS